jgi:membrane associated rhomboid family serine protease
MAMASRNYRSGSYGNSGSRFQFGGGEPLMPGLKFLLISIVSVFVAEYLIALKFEQPGTDWVLKWFALIPSAVIPGLRLWQPFTYIFLHSLSDLMHIIMNMLVLWMFGRMLEPVWGTRRFLNYFFLCGIGAGLVNVIANVLPMMWGRAPSDIPTIGASGAIYGILIACAILFPDRQVFIFPLPIAIPMRWFVAIMAGIEFFSEFRSSHDQISHISHLGGMLIGYVYLRRGTFFSGARNEISDWKRKRNMRKFQVYMRKKSGEPPAPPDRWVN